MRVRERVYVRKRETENERRFDTTNIENRS